MRKYTYVSVATGILSLALAIGAYANHSWGGYHWGRTANPFTLELGDNVSPAWDGYLATAASDWSVSSVLDMVVKRGNTKPRTCKATTGRVEVCSEKYGNTGWLGVAQIWISGDHITKGIVKVNDTYYTMPTYDTPAWRQLVMCQEIGHAIGLDHQDEVSNNANLGTCMDYTNDPSTNQHPNQHDYDELETIYAHLDNVDTVIASTSGGGTGGNGRGNGKPEGAGDIEDPSMWGKSVREDAKNHTSLYMRDLGNGEKVFTFVTWIQ